MNEKPENTGVQELIDRLSEEGVEQGRRQAGDIVADAEQKVDALLDAARREATEIVDRARDEAARYQSAGEDALRLAARDAAREFGSKLHEGLRNRLQELVGEELADRELIKQMILEVTRRGTEDLGDHPIEFLVPQALVTEHQARERINAGDKDELTRFVEDLIGENLREGFTIGLGPQSQNGVVVRVAEQHVEIDFTPDAVSEVLSQHLLPRFRAIMRDA